MGWYWMFWLPFMERTSMAADRKSLTETTCSSTKTFPEGQRNELAGEDKGQGWIFQFTLFEEVIEK